MEGIAPMLEAIASRLKLEAIASRLEAIASRLRRDQLGMFLESTSSYFRTWGPSHTPFSMRFIGEFGQSLMRTKRSCRRCCFNCLGSPAMTRRVEVEFGAGKLGFGTSSCPVSWYVRAISNRSQHAALASCTSHRLSMLRQSSAKEIYDNL